MIPLSVLDLAPIPAGSSASQALANTLDLAQHAERWGYNRYWLAEHHNMAGHRQRCDVDRHRPRRRRNAYDPRRFGRNHAAQITRPLVIAEQFGTLESLYPGRIDLGLGRAPGTDQLTVRALRRDAAGADSFPHDVVELQRYFAAAVPHQGVRAVPGAGLHVPIWLLGSSMYSAQLAAALGLPFAFASHFAPQY